MKAVESRESGWDPFQRCATRQPSSVREREGRCGEFASSYPRRVLLAYVVLAHVQPRQLARLIRRLHTPQDTFFVHIDRKTDAGPFLYEMGEAALLPNVHFLDRTKVYWGAFGQLEATLTGLRAAALSEMPYDYLVLLTGRDYPIKPLDEIRGALSAGSGRIYLHHRALPIAEWDEEGGLERLAHRHIRLFHPARRFPGPIRDRYIRYGHVRLPMRRRMPDGLPPYVGSAFWWLPRDCVQYIQRYGDEHADVLRFFRHVFAPEESFFQMVLMSSPHAKRVINDQLRYTEWRPGDWPHGSTLRAVDLPKLASTDKLFASKFDDRRDARVLDLVDAQLLGGPPSV